MSNDDINSEDDEEAMHRAAKQYAEATKEFASAGKLKQAQLAQQLTERYYEALGLDEAWHDDESCLKVQTPTLFAVEASNGMVGVIDDSDPDDFRRALLVEPNLVVEVER
jgi:hypothetical protein